MHSLAPNQPQRSERLAALLADEDEEDAAEIRRYIAGEVKYSFLNRMHSHFCFNDTPKYFVQAHTK